MKDHPEMELVGQDGNIFFILGSASRILKRNGLQEEATEMFARVQESGDYYAALGIISQYVQTEMSDPDPGILEAEDIRIDPELIPDETGVTAYVETWFDVERRFGIQLGPDKSADFYATVQPETGAFKAWIIVKREPSGEHEYRDVRLLPGERKLITGQMEELVQRNTGKNLKELYAEWKQEYGSNPTHSKNKERKPKHER